MHDLDADAWRQASEPDGNNARLDSEVFGYGGEPAVASGSTGGNIADGAVGSFTLPAGSLSAGAHCRWHVRAYDGQNYGPWSAWSDSPANLQTFAIDSMVTVAWQAAPTAGSDVTSYTVAASPGGATVSTPDGNTTSAAIAGLPNGVSYTLVVKAHSAVGDSPDSARVLTDSTGDFWRSILRLRRCCLHQL